MLEIFFSEGAAGSILDAKPASISDISSTTDAFPAAKTSPDAGSMTTENHTAVEEIISNSHHINNSVEFDPDKILCFPLDLSIGDISAPFSDSRADFLQSQMLLYGSDFADVGRELVETARRSLSRVQSCTEPLRIWYSRNPDELCGFCHLLSLLPKNADIRVVELPDHELLGAELRRYSGWADVEPSEFSRLVALERPLSPLERRSFVALWRDLQAENGDLRALVNDRLCTVGADFYDFFLLQELQWQPQRFHEAMLIGEILGRHLPGISDRLVALRIEELISRGILIPATAPAENSPLYHRFLLKCTSE